MDRTTTYGDSSNLSDGILISPLNSIPQYRRLNRQKTGFKCFVCILSYILCAVVFIDLGFIMSISTLNFTNTYNDTQIPGLTGGTCDIGDYFCPYEDDVPGADLYRDDSG